MSIQGLEFHSLDVKFTEGLDTKDNPKIVVAGKWLELINVSMSEDNTPRRRDGIRPLHDNGGQGFVTFDDELLVVRGSALQSLPVTGDYTAEVPGQIANVGVARNASIVHNSLTQDSPDMACGEGYTCYVWRQLNAVAGTVDGVYVMLTEEATGAQIIPPTVMSSGASEQCPRVAFADNHFFIFYFTATGPDIRCRVIHTVTPTTLSAATTLISHATDLSGINFEICAYGDGVGIVYGWGNGTTSVLAAWIEEDAGVPTILYGPTPIVTEAELAAANLTGMTLSGFMAPDDGKVGIVVVGTGADPMSGMSVTIVDFTFSVIAGPTLIDSTVGPTSGALYTAINVTCIDIEYAGGTPALQIFWDEISAYNDPRLNLIRTAFVDASATSLQAPYTLVNSNSFDTGTTVASGPQGPWICGKAFKNAEGSTFLPVCVLEAYESLGVNTANLNQQNSFFVLEGGEGWVVGRALYGTFGNPRTSIDTYGPPCSTPYGPRDEPNENAIMVPERPDLAEFSNGVNQTQSGLCRLTLTPNITYAPRHAQLARSAYITGGVLSQFDGSIVVNTGFSLFPEGCSARAVAATGSNTAGVHQIVFVYEWLDGQGQRHQSAPSLPISVTFLAGGHVLCLIPSLQLQGITRTEIRIVPYVTQAAGLTFNRVFMNNGSAAPVMNATGATTVGFRINGADTEWASNEPLYTQPTQAGTTLANVAPPPCSALTIHQDRLFIDATDNPGAYRFSQQPIAGVGLQWSNQLGGKVPVDAGAIVAFASLDEKLIIFTERRIYGVFGTGPTSAGLNSSYSDPVQIPSDVGCLSRASVLRMPMGIIFQSTKGWYLVGRDLAVKYIGGGVAAYDFETPGSVWAATMLEDRQECRFLLRTGSTLVYNYMLDQWSISRCAVSYEPQDALWWPTIGRYVHTSSGGNGTNQDEPETFTDDFPNHEPAPGEVTNIEMVMRTAWLKVNSINGFQRVRWLYLTGTGSPIEADHQRGTFTIRCEFDDILANSGAAVGPGGYEVELDLADIAIGNPLKSYDLRHKILGQKCKSVSFTFYDSSTVIGWESLGLQVGVKRGTNKLPAAQGV